MTTKLTLNNLTPETLAAISGPRISNVQIADSQYNTLDDTAANVGGGYIIINGQSFNSAAQVLIDQTPATTITWVSNTQIRAEIPASTEGTSKSVYVINPDGSLALLVNGLTYSAFPAWSTGSTLTSSEALVPISIQLSAPSATVYTLAAANTLPSSLSLYANGLIAGTVAANTTTNYNFTVNAKDAENQDTSRNFTLPITRNVEPAWTTAADLGSAPVNENYLNTLVATDLSSIIYSVAVGSSLPANLTLAANGLLSGSVSTANTYSFAIVATDTANLSNTRTFSISIIAPDPYSSYNTLLLNGEGAASTNGSNNSVFIDSSTNNFNINRFGNPSQGTRSPYGYNWSNYFDGTGDYLTAPSNVALNLTGDFTIEFWAYPTASISSKSIAGTTTSSMHFDSGGYFYLLNSTGQYLRATDASFLTLNTWTHVSISRSGSTLKFFKNGIDNGVAENVGSASTATFTFSGLDIGYSPHVNASAYLTGYISNFRIVKGTGVYTGAFTPSTTPLTAITNTSLLTCQSNRLIDNSTNNFTITKNGDVSVQAFSPFLQSATRYTPSVNGGSAYFGGSAALSTTGSNLVLGTGDFTIEMWVYIPANTGTYQAFYNSRNNGAGFFFGLDNGGMHLMMYYGGILTTDANTLTLNQWNHVALVRYSGTTKIYKNGVAVGTPYTDGNNYTSTVTEIGRDLSFSYDTVGWISNVRIVKGTAVYTTAFTPPTSPLTAIANTSLLTNFTNAGIIDQTGQNNLETVGNAQLSTSVKKYGSASMYFDGTGDYIYQPSSINYGYGTGNFTIEFWLYLNSTGLQTILSHLASNPQVKPHIYYSSGVRLYINGSDVITGGTVTISTWTHIALVRNSGSTRLYINGTQSGSTYTDSNNYGTSSPLIIGDYSVPVTGTNMLNGYIDDLRITKGYARYTTTFTPPTAIT